MNRNVLLQCREKNPSQFLWSTINNIYQCVCWLLKLLQEQGVCMRTTAEMEIVREMKEKCCCVALDYEAELSRGGSSCREMRYTMPDGQVVTLSTERFRCHCSDSLSEGH